MIKVFLVEDEIIVREGLRKNIRWNELGLECVGEAADGELAYPLIQETRPDILITDIKMPFMNGLQLSGLIKKEMPWIKIIIISGHDDFEYAQKAIGVGVAEYLIKPVNSAKITQTVLRIKADIECEKEAYLIRFKSEMKEYEKLERKQFFKELVSKKISVSELLEKGRRLDVALSANGYNIILFQLTQDKDLADAYVEDLIKMEQKLEECFAIQTQAILFERDLEGFAILVKGGAKLSPIEATDRCLNILRDIIGCDEKISFFAVAGTPVLRLNELSGVFEEVRRAFVYRYTCGKGEVLYSRDMKNLTQTQNREMNLENLDPSKMAKKILERFLRSASVEDTSDFLSDYFENIGNDLMASLLFRQYIAMDAVFTVISFVVELGADRGKFSGKFANQRVLTEALYGVRETHEYLMKIITEAFRLRDASASKKYGALLENARAFISENYGRDDISLNMAAASVNISPSHFSTIFSQETGCTFIEYLTQMRMEKATELLRCSGMRTSEVAYAVGYRDPHYFSYLFKKRQGCTPKEYRLGKQEKAEYSSEA